jgi:DNA-binding LytR/AlgR family response regulator
MLKIAICDDISAELRHIAALTKEYLTERNVSADIREFSHPDALLTAFGAENFHIYLLDIVMPMISGLELGRSIRRVSTDAQIIYITTEPGFALDAYSVNPLHYLLKPVDKGALFAALEMAAEKVGFGEETVVTFKTKEGLRTLSADMVVFCEYVRHTAIYTLTSGERVETLTISGSFAGHVAPLMRDRRFIQPHAAFIVNMRHVDRLSRDGFSMKGGACVPVSGKQFSAVRNAYMSYRLGEM